MISPPIKKNGAFLKIVTLEKLHNLDLFYSRVEIIISSSLYNYCQRKDSTLLPKLFKQINQVFLLMENLSITTNQALIPDLNLSFIFNPVTHFGCRIVLHFVENQMLILS